jgi:hypothetical protein
MKAIRFLLLAALAVTLFSCGKEYSLENSGNFGSDLIVGFDCRISKIVYTDTSANTNLGSIAADINSIDIVNRINKYDSLSNIIEYLALPTYSNDTVFINGDEYFITDANRRINKMHGLVDPTNPASLQFDVFYVYDAAGHLINKNYFLTGAPAFMYYQVTYTYTNGNLTRMEARDLVSGDLNIDADLSFFTNIVPKNYLYIFPDEKNYYHFNQFYNFGLKNYNAVKKITVRNYDPGNVVRDSTVSNFSNYIMSRDTYVLSVQMAGDEQLSIPAPAAKLSFYYHCK